MSNQVSAVDKIIQKWFPVIGSLFVVGGLVYLFYDGMWEMMDKQSRMFVGVLAGVAMIAGGYATSAKLKQYADVLIGGGAVILYATFLYAARFPDVGIGRYESPEILSLFIGFILASGMAFYALQRKSKYILGLGLFAGYITPLVLSIFGALLNYEDARADFIYNSSFITFFLYFIAINLTVLYVSNKMSLKGFGLANSLGLFLGTISLLIMTGVSDFQENFVFTLLATTAVVIIHIWSMVVSARSFANQNDPLLYLGYLLPLAWFAIMSEMIQIISNSEVYLTVLYTLISLNFFGAWYYLKNTTNSNEHFGLYAGGVLSMILAVISLTTGFYGINGLIFSGLSVIFGVLYFIKPIVQRLLTFWSVATVGLFLILADLQYIYYDFQIIHAETVFLCLALLPFLFGLAFNHKHPKENTPFIQANNILAIISGLFITILLVSDVVSRVDIAKDFLFLTVPAIFLAIYALNQKDEKKQLTFLTTSLVVGFMGYLITAFQLLGKMSPTYTHTDYIFGSQASRIAFITLILFATIYHFTKKLSIPEKNGLRIFSLLAVSLVFLQFITNEIIAFYNTLGIDSATGNTQGIMALTQTIFWTAFGSYLIYLGIQKESHRLEKNVGFGILILAAIKLFSYDLIKIDSTLKVILLLVIGVLIMGISYIYNQKNSQSDEKDLEEKVEDKK